MPYTAIGQPSLRGSVVIVAMGHAPAKIKALKTMKGGMFSCALPDPVEPVLPVPEDPVLPVPADAVAPDMECE